MNSFLQAARDITELLTRPMGDKPQVDLSVDDFATLTRIRDLCEKQGQIDARFGLEKAP